MQKLISSFIITITLTLGLTGLTAQAERTFRPIDRPENYQTPAEQTQAYLTGYIYDQKSAKYLTYDQIIQSKVTITAEYYNGSAKNIQTATYNNQGKFFLTIPVSGQSKQQVQVRFESPAYQSQSMTLSLSQSRSITIVTQPIEKPAIPTETAYISGYFYDQKNARYLTAAEISAAAIQVNAKSTYTLSPVQAVFTSQGKYILSIPSNGQKQTVTVTFKSSVYQEQTFTVEVTDNRTRTIVLSEAVPVITLPTSY